MFVHWAEQEGCTKADVRRRYSLMWAALGADSTASRIVNALWRNGYRTPEKVAAASLGDLADLRHFGATCLDRTAKYQATLKPPATDDPVTTYTVRWEQDIKAVSPLDAMRQAMALLTGPLEGSGIEPFEVADELGNTDVVDPETEAMWVLRRIRPHSHTFVGDEDTCQFAGGCPVTWHQYQTMEHANVPRETPEGS